MRFEVKGLNKLKTKVGKLPSVVQEGAENAVNDIAEEAAGRAVANLSDIKIPSGELEGSVKHAVTTTSRTGETVAMVWSDKKQAMYRELGTGPVGEKSPKDLPPGITPVYTQQAWFFSVSASLEDLTIYGIPKIEIQGVEFYRTSGQPARPWLYPALKYIEENLASNIVKRNVSEAIKKGLK